MLVLKAGVSKLRIDELTFSPDGTMLAAPAGAQGLCLWPSLAQPKSDVLKPPVPRVKRLVFAPQGRIIYAGSDHLCAFDLIDRNGTCVDLPSWDSLWFGPSPDGERLVVAERPEGGDSVRLTCWLAGELASPVWEHRAESRAYSPPLYLAGTDHFVLVEGAVRLTDRWEYCYVRRSVKTGCTVDRSEPLEDFPDETVLSPDGTRLACRTRESIRFYPVEGKWQTVPTITNDNKKHFTGVGYHPSGQYLAATSNDMTVKLYDTVKWRVVKAYTWNVGRLRSVAFSPDGTRAAVGSDRGQVVVWDVDL
jgi:WD40 repeat protein